MPPYLRPTHRQRVVIVALVETGSVRLAAQRLGLSERNVLSILRRTRQRTGLASTEQVVYIGTRDGWLTAPDLCTNSDTYLLQGVAARG